MNAPMLRFVAVLGVSAVLVVPLFVLEWWNRRELHEEFPLVLFTFMSAHSLLIVLGREISRELQRRVAQLCLLIDSERPDAVRNLHPAYGSVLVTFDPRRTSTGRMEEAAGEWLRRLKSAELPPARQVEIPVCYGSFFGPDLGDVAVFAGLSCPSPNSSTPATGSLRREAIAASLTADERLELLRGMVLTRAIDNRLKQFFLGAEVRYGNAAFQGKGFRSLGQEAIYAAPLRLRRGPAWRAADGTWRGDVIAPVIRDLGAALAMRPDAASVRSVLSAQMAKAGPPMNGKDLHVGDFAWGVLPASAPLPISTMPVAGLALAFALEGSERVAVSFIGEGGSSLGEWHEAINLCAAHRLPAVFCVQNNQTALSTPVAAQCAARVFADNAASTRPGIGERRWPSCSAEAW